MENTEQNGLPPDFLYHYYSFKERNKTIFTKNQIYFQSPREFNDPFDTTCKYILEGNEQKKKEFLLGLQSRHPKISTMDINYVLSHPQREKEFLGKMENRDSIGRNAGIYCLTAKNDDILMWSHYADSLKGFCLKFSTKNDFFVLAYKINYIKQRLIRNLLCLGGIEETKALFLSKSDDWSYEEEYRCIIPDGVGKRTFPDNALVGVILGCKMEDSNKNKIIQWCYRRNHRPQLFTAVPKESDYGLNIQPLEYPTKEI